MTHHTTESVERLAQRCNENHRLMASIVFPLNDECATTLMDLCAERDAMRARLGEAEAVLKPLADMAAVYEPDDGDGEDVCWSAMAAPQIKHLRAARAFLNGGDNG